MILLIPQNLLHNVNVCINKALRRAEPERLLVELMCWSHNQTVRRYMQGAQRLVLQILVIRKDTRSYRRAHRKGGEWPAAWSLSLRLPSRSAREEAASATGWGWASPAIEGGVFAPAHDLEHQQEIGLEAEAALVVHAMCIGIAVPVSITESLPTATPDAV